MDFGFFARTRNMLRYDKDTELLGAELFSIEQLKGHAITYTKTLNIDPHPGPDRLLPCLAENARVLAVTRWGEGVADENSTDRESGYGIG